MSQFSRLLLGAIAAVSISMTSVAQDKNIGGQKDSHGCLTAAGYQWSELQKKCIRIWEGTTQLESTGSEKNQAAYVYLNTAKTSAEVFLPEGAVVMKQTKAGEYAGKDYTLTTTSGMVLQQKGKVVWRSAGSSSTGAPLKVNNLKADPQPGRVVFTKGKQTVFYFEPDKKKGAISLNGKNYTLTNYKFDTDTYTLSGDGVTIGPAKFKFKENEGTDCSYGKANVVNITVGKDVVKLTDVNVQDCPNY